MREGRENHDTLKSASCLRRVKLVKLKVSKGSSNESQY